MWEGAPVTTGIFKQPVAGAVMIRETNLDGDRQADLTVHGGAEKAAYGYPAEHYALWREELPEVEFSWAQFGENLTTEGLCEDTLCIGDRLQIGDAILTVTQPRLPCYKLGLRFGRDDMVKRFLISRRCGFYFSVEREGEVIAGSAIQFLSRDPEQVSVADIFGLFLNKTRAPELLHRAARVSALPLSWKHELMLRAQARGG
jgi:MOSC domain-containing protein YiiM